MATSLRDIVSLSPSEYSTLTVLLEAPRFSLHKRPCHTPEPTNLLLMLTRACTRSSRICVSVKPTQLCCSLPPTLHAPFPPGASPVPTPTPPPPTAAAPTPGRKRFERWCVWSIAQERGERETEPAGCPPMSNGDGDRGRGRLLALADGPSLLCRGRAAPAPFGVSHSRRLFP